MQDTGFIASFQSGNEKAFQDIFERYYNRLHYFAARMLYSPEAAEDVVQEAFAKLWQRREHFRSEEAVKGFLYITVKNSCRNIYEHTQVVHKFEQASFSLAEEKNKLHLLIEAEVLEHISQALQELPEGCRKVIHLSYFQGFRNKEIAEQLHVSVNTVKTQKMRALYLLRGLLKAISALILFLHLTGR